MQGEWESHGILMSMGIIHNIGNGAEWKNRMVKWESPHSHAFPLNFVTLYCILF